MDREVEQATEIVSDVLYRHLFARFGERTELTPEAEAIARKLPRIRSHGDATLALRRVIESSFGIALPLDEHDLARAARDLVQRLRSAGLLAAPIREDGK